MLSVLRLAITAGLSIPRAQASEHARGLKRGRPMGLEWQAVEDALTRWERQMATPYADLTEGEKASDREWADRVIEVVNGSTTVRLSPAQMERLIAAGLVLGDGAIVEWLVQRAEVAHRLEDMVAALKAMANREPDASGDHWSGIISGLREAVRVMEGTP